MKNISLNKVMLSLLEAIQSLFMQRVSLNVLFIEKQ